MEILLEPTSNKLMIILTKAGNLVKKILLKLNLSDHRSILTDLQVTPTKPGRMTKPYSSYRFIANCFNAENLKMEVKVLLKKLPEKLRDPRIFLIPCDFYGLESCMALPDLCASINLMPLYVWKKLSLPNLTPNRMTLELATRSIAYPASIAKDVFVQVGKFTFPADFVVVDYGVYPRIPLILGRPFFEDGPTSKHPHKHENESINMINFIDITCEDHFPEVLKIKKLNHPSSGSTTLLSDSLPSLIHFETSDSLLEEFADELALLDPFSPRNKDDNFDPKADLRKIKYLLKQDSSTESDIDIIDPVLKSFTDKPTLDYSPPPGDDDDDDDDLFDLKSDNDEWKKLFNSTLPEESSEIASLSSSPFENKDKVFNPGILILGGTQIFNDESKDKDLKDKDLILEEHNFLSISSDKELLLHLELTVRETLLSFLSKNEDKVFNPEILTSKGVHSLTMELSHRTYKTFKIVNIHPNIFNEGPMKIFLFFCYCLKDKGIRFESGS
nr:hypothetical protein [Tanacetum cinerariifolium]